MGLSPLTSGEEESQAEQGERIPPTKSHHWGRIPAAERSGRRHEEEENVVGKRGGDLDIRCMWWAYRDCSD